MFGVRDAPRQGSGAHLLFLLAMGTTARLRTHALQVEDNGSSEINNAHERYTSLTSKPENPWVDMTRKLSDACPNPI